MEQNNYWRLVVMAALSFVAMYVLMYSMVDSASNVYNNWNQAYMAALMAAPMVLIELVLMRGMYRNTRLNAWLLGASVVVGIVCFVFIRQQTAISDRQFLRSMIPHHSGAILMCARAAIQTPAVKELCTQIIDSQEREIAEMRRLLEDPTIR